MRLLRKYWKIWLPIVAAVFLLVIYFGVRYRRHISFAFGFVSDETGGKAMAILVLLVSALIGLYLVFCLALPFVIFFGLRDLRSRSAALEKQLESLRSGQVTHSEPHGNDGPTLARQRPAGPG